MARVQYDDNGPGGVRLAYREDGAAAAPNRCGFFWLGGFRSDMEGAKAEGIASLAHEGRRASLRFDYSGHGGSGGNFEDGTISHWLAEAEYMFKAHAAGRRIVIGSSMGAWLALLLAKRAAVAGRIGGLLLIAPAADMTAELMWNKFGAEARAAIRDKGVWHMPSAYGEPYPITAKLIDDGARHLLLAEGVSLGCPVHIVQGDADREVTPAHALKVYEAVKAPEVCLTLVKGGDHRLSSPSQLALVCDATSRLAERADELHPV